jgi:hypothetical protein
MDRRPAAFAATRTQDALTWRHQVSSAGHTESRSSAQAGMEPSPCARSSRRRPSTPTRLRRAESRPNLSTNPQPAAKNAPRPDRAAPAVHHWAAVCRHFLDAPTSHSDPTPSACPPVPQSTSQEPANRRFAGTSKRLKGLEPSTFCMANRRRATRRAGLPAANSAKQPVQPRRVLSRISPRFAGVLSTNCPPRIGGRWSIDSAWCAAVCLDVSNRHPHAPLLPVTGCGSGTDSDRAPADARCSSAASVSALSVDSPLRAQERKARAHGQPLPL